MQAFLHGNTWLKLNSCCLQISTVPMMHCCITPAPFTRLCYLPGFRTLQPWFKLTFLPGGPWHPVQIIGSEEGQGNAAIRTEVKKKIKPWSFQ